MEKDLLNSSEVKLSEVLARIIADSEFNRNRKKLTEDLLHITPSALSQYIHGKASPRFDTLVAMARIFNVSLDYLVFGIQKAAAAPLDYGPVARHMDWALAKVAAKEDQRAELSARIARQLVQQIDAAAKKATDLGLGLPPALLSDDETLILETYSLDSWILSMNLQYDIVKEEGADPAAGRFLTVVVNNLRQGRRYRFLLPRVRDWTDAVASYRQLVRGLQVSDQLLAQNCGFKSTDQPAIVGCGLYKLDIPGLQRDEPMLAERLRHVVSEDGWVGYTIAPSPELQADALMDPFHRDNARSAFQKMWKKAKSI